MSSSTRPPGAHYSYAIRDAVELLTVPVVEVHLSNVDEREDWRRVSVISDLAAKRVIGRGPEGYQRGAGVPGGDAVVKDRLDRLQAALEEPLLVSQPGQRPLPLRARQLERGAA